MSKPVIKVENLSKKYVIQHQQDSYKTFRGAITDAAKSLTKAINPRHKEEAKLVREEFWALNDVSFEIQQGDRVGIIGRNGAGKSTLLKILSRITEPTSGKIRISGRVASLLEVGTGFHPELTGRENIFLNGAILGMSKLEIQRKFDEIVDFAEIEKFLDTPVKRYSSGMYVRLAFAVAAHLEPEILIVDEVLAVGDAQFQKKCLGKMEEVGKQGRTVLFVSHNMGTITQLCTTGIYLAAGKVVQLGNINSVIGKYLAQGSSNNGKMTLVNNIEQVRKKKKLFFKQVCLVNDEYVESSELDVRYPFYVKFDYEVTQPVNNVDLSIRIHTSDGIAVLTSNQSDNTYGENLKTRNIGSYEASIEIPGMFLMPGSYMLSIAAHEPMVEIFDIHEHILLFTITETGTRYAKYNQSRETIGIIIANLPWSESTKGLDKLDFVETFSKST
ncbi:ABC transporter-related protein [Calothrix sp. NIES-4071]|nr:ABC transporter-related protein [Calothrix sp. NIES-4071]BAZ56379.1 ABC transporter-related protein [Calothrix sp. NIES-4105]